MEQESKAEWAVEAEGIRKSFDHHRVLTGLSFRIGHGEHLVIMGRNGCGKTTLINILATTSRPSRGKVVIDGFDTAKQSAKARMRLGVVAHQVMLYGGLTIAENLRFYGRMYKVEFLEDRIESLIRRFGLEKWPSHRVGSLSRGIQQRVALARALIHEPSVFLLDEPETGLDPAALTMLENMLGELKEKGGTVIATSHNLDFTVSTCSRVAILSHGRFVYESTNEGLAAASLKEALIDCSERGL